MIHSQLVSYIPTRPSAHTIFYLCISWYIKDFHPWPICVQMRQSIREWLSDSTLFIAYYFSPCKQRYGNKENAKERGKQKEGKEMGPIHSTPFLPFHFVSFFRRRWGLRRMKNKQESRKTKWNGNIRRTITLSFGSGNGNEMEIVRSKVWYWSGMKLLFSELSRS